MGGLRYPSLELFRLNPVLEHVNLVPVEFLNAVNNLLLLDQLLLLRLSESALFLQELILLQIRSQLVDFLAESDLLGIALVHQRLLLVQ